MDTRLMEKWHKYIIGFLILSLVLFSCTRREKSDNVPHILLQIGNNQTMRVDYYEGKEGALFFYFTDDYDDYVFSESYADLLMQVKKNKWEFKRLFYSFLSIYDKKYRDEKFIYKIKNMNDSILNKKATFVGYDLDGFIFKID